MYTSADTAACIIRCFYIKLAKVMTLMLLRLSRSLGHIEFLDLTPSDI